MATGNAYLTTPTKTPSSTSTSSLSRKQQNPNSTSTTSSSSSRFEAYNRLQAAAVAFGEKLPIPEIVALGGQSDGKSSLLEALLGFRFNVREVEMGTRRPLILQMVHDHTAVEPRCRFQVHLWILILYYHGMPKIDISGIFFGQLGYWALTIGDLHFCLVSKRCWKMK